MARIEAEARRRAADLLAAHQRARAADQRKGKKSVLRYSVEPQRPADVFGVYVFLPCG